LLNVHERNADRYQAYHCMAFSGLIKAKESQQIRGEGEREEKRRERKKKTGVQKEKQGGQSGTGEKRRGGEKHREGERKEENMRESGEQ